MRLLKLLLFSLIFGQVYAQTTPYLDPLVPFNYGLRELYGSHYLNKDWNKGKIVLKQKGKLKKYNPLDVRYNLAHQNLEVKFKNVVSGKEYVKIFNEILLQRFEYQNTKTKRIERFERCKNFNTGTSMIGFFKILYQGKKVQLLASLTSYEQKRLQFLKLGFISYDERVIHKAVYYMTKGGKTYKIKRRRKFILDQFDDRRKEVKAYAKANKLFYKSEEDLTAIFKYYDGLK